MISSLVGDVMQGYHITNTINVSSILQDGLVPNLGVNSIYMGEDKLQVYFSSKKGIHLWRHDVKNFYKGVYPVTLKFLCNNIEYHKNREYIELDEYSTTDIIEADDIFVAGENRISLLEYYQKNKLEINHDQGDVINIKISELKENLHYFKFKVLSYDKIIENIRKIIDIFKLVKSSEKKNDFMKDTYFLINEILNQICYVELADRLEEDLLEIYNIIFSNSAFMNVMVLEYLFGVIKCYLMLQVESSFSINDIVKAYEFVEKNKKIIEKHCDLMNISVLDCLIKDTKKAYCKLSIN